MQGMASSHKRTLCNWKAPSHIQSLLQEEDQKVKELDRQVQEMEYRIIMMISSRV